jgi:hypothetical protein
MTKVLLVEDQPEIRDVVRSQLERSGFVVIIAKNGKEGVETAIAAKPDLILMNCKMPEMGCLRWMVGKPRVYYVRILRLRTFRSSRPRHCSSPPILKPVLTRMQRLHRQAIYVPRTPEED